MYHNNKEQQQQQQQQQQPDTLITTGCAMNMAPTMQVQHACRLQCYLPAFLV
jgi:hypothetical protein